MNKEEVINALEESRQDFLDAIEGLSDEDILTPVFDSWSVKDVMAHLTMWEAELVKLLFQTRQGQKPTTVHFSKVTVDEHNEKWYRQNKDRPLERIWDDFRAVRKQTIRRVESFTDQDLTNPNLLPWFEGTPLWKRIAEDSFEHEEEHSTQIREWRKES